MSKNENSSAGDSRLDQLYHQGRSDAMNKNDYKNPNNGCFFDPSWFLKQHDAYAKGYNDGKKGR